MKLIIILTIIAILSIIAIIILKDSKEKYDNELIKCNPNDVLNMVYLYDKTSNKLLSSQSIFNGPGCQNPKKLSDIMNTNTVTIANLNSIPESTKYNSFFICLVGDLKCGFKKPDDDGNFSDDSLTDSRFDVKVIDSKTIVLSKASTENDPGSIPKFNLYVYNNVTGITQTYNNIYRPLSYGGDGPFGTRVLNIFPVQLTPDDVSISNYYKIDSKGKAVPSYLFIGPELEIISVPPPDADIDNAPEYVQPPENRNWIYPTPTKTCDTIVSVNNSPNYIIKNNNSKILSSEYLTAGNNKIPKCFSWRFYGLDKIEEARNQETCGACWAIAIASCLGDRFAIKNNIASPYPSDTWLLSACSEFKGLCPMNTYNEQQGCIGGHLESTLEMLSTDKLFIKLNSCWPFSIVSSHNYYAPDYLGSPELDNCCYDCCGGNDLRHTVKFSIKSDSLNYIGLEDATTYGNYTQNQIDIIQKKIQNEIFNNGPVIASIIEFDYLTYFTSEISNAPPNTRNTYIFDNSQSYPVKDYEKCRRGDPTQECRGMHSVVITGWGVTSTGIKYWEVRNSYGKNMADNGYFKVEFSKVDNQNKWIGIDIPYYDKTKNVLFGGTICFTPNDIENLDELIDKGIFKRPTQGPATSVCPTNIPTVCNPDCENKVCGSSDGCGGFCYGTCSVNQTCFKNSTGAVCNCQKNWILKSKTNPNEIYTYDSFNSSDGKNYILVSPIENGTRSSISVIVIDENTIQIGQEFRSDGVINAPPIVGYWANLTLITGNPGIYGWENANAMLYVDKSKTC